MCAAVDCVYVALPLYFSLDDVIDRYRSEVIIDGMTLRSPLRHVSGHWGRTADRKRCSVPIASSVALPLHINDYFYRCKGQGCIYSQWRGEPGDEARVPTFCISFSLPLSLPLLLPSHPPSLPLTLFSLLSVQNPMPLNSLNAVHITSPDPRNRTDSIILTQAQRQGEKVGALLLRKGVDYSVCSILFTKMKPIQLVDLMMY